jgi:simple sugar transport system substrate-binding protein
MKKHLIACSLLALFAATGAHAADKLRMGIVVKIGGIPWFNAMEAGIKSEAAKRGIDAWMVGPTAACPAGACDRRFDCAESRHHRRSTE